MIFNGIRVSFACRLCTRSFNQVSNFLAHKKEKHFQEFQRTPCIVFEEKPSSLNSNHSNAECSLPSSTVLVKLETFDDASLNFEPGPEPEPKPPSRESSSMHSNFEFVLNKNEPIQNEIPSKHEIQLQPQFKNPFVLLKRINRREIQKFTEENSYRESYVATPISDATDALMCRLCHKNFSSDPQLRSHVEICLLYNNNKTNLAYCAKCNEFFPSSKELQDHINIFHAQKIILDKNIPTATSGSKRFRNNSEHLNSSPIIGCFEQNPTKASNGLVDRLPESVVDSQHQYQHVRATVCKSDLTDRKKLIKQNKASSTSHSSKRRFKCSFPNCGNSFTAKWVLQDHVGRHTGSKPYKCQVPNCGKAFTHKGSWYNHKKTHSDASLYKCPVTSCSVAFRTKISIRRHLIAAHSLRKSRTGFGGIVVC